MTHSPYPFGNRWAWCRARNDIPNFPEDLPWSVFDRLMGGEMVTGVRYYATRDDALAALGEAEKIAQSARSTCR